MYETRDFQFSGDLQQRERSFYVRFESHGWFVDAAVYVGFGCEVDDGVAIGHSCLNGDGIANVSLDESIVCVIRDGVKIRQIAGVGQVVKID